MRLIDFAATCGLLLAGSFSAAAAPVKLEKTYSGIFGSGGNEAVTIVNTGTPNLSQRVRAGGFRVTDATNNFDLIAWCVDIANALKLPSLYGVTSEPFSNTFDFTSDIKNNIESLFETAYLDLDLADNSQSAGFQLALWEIVFETSDTLDVGNGTFSTVASMDTVSAANGFLANLGGPVTQSYQLNYYESLGYKNGKKYSQNLVSVTPVPLPAAGFLLVGGLAGLYFSGKRRKS